MEILSQMLQGVEELSLYGCYRLTPNAVYSLSNPDSRLQRLNVSGVYKISTDVIYQGLLTTHHDILLYNDPNLFGESRKG